MELQLPAYTTATATPDPSCVCNPHHSSRQCRILNPLSEARDRTCHLTVPSWIHFCCTTMGTPTFLCLMGSCHLQSGSSGRSVLGLGPKACPCLPKHGQLVAHPSPVPALRLGPWGSALPSSQPLPSEALTCLTPPPPTPTAAPFAHPAWSRVSSPTSPQPRSGKSSRLPWFRGTLGHQDGSP